MHSHEILSFHGLFDILNVVWYTLRENSDGLTKLPGFICIKAQVQCRSNGITYHRYTLYLFMDAEPQSNFQLYTGKTVQFGIQCSPGCCCRCLGADNCIDSHGCPWN